MAPTARSTASPTATGPAAALRDREEVATRLLAASDRHSFDPDKELDWDAPFTDGLWYWPPELVSLYDTPLWRRMSEEQRILLSKHEASSIAAAGIWFETILMQLLLRHIYDHAPTSGHARYALTEIADECRHSKMFARLITTLDTPLYGPTTVDHHLARFLKSFSTTPGSFTGTLLCEEILDWMQRLVFPDERVQPLMRGVTRIHVIEESRHVRYAREELRRQMLTAGRAEKAYVRGLTAEIARVVMRTLISPRAYAECGIDPKAAMAQARRSPHRRETLRASAAKLVAFFDETGVLDGPASRAVWRTTGLLAGRG
ncbi:hypothetical protein BIV57_06825 [Mangrovactinospora gilvigrisea]|uniref:Diiron oxygenase n=1 Tax=Mangrovactinospora gilvigrisea TaxID=1428644 RepID=A0A1J7CEX1_9ACTN|nr:diiron oxygenase [Mangrovactinospora gilvigrisea]OIV38242.1 hypothetical protein BIV57_06825 [Mangrovactinospora gilvigrisea]